MRKKTKEKGHKGKVIIVLVVVIGFLFVSLAEIVTYPRCKGVGMIQVLPLLWEECSLCRGHGQMTILKYITDWVLASITSSQVAHFVGADMLRWVTAAGEVS